MKELYERLNLMENSIKNLWKELATEPTRNCKTFLDNNVNVIKLKREIRRFNSLDTSDMDSAIRWINECEGIQRINFDGVFSEEEKEDYIRRNSVHPYSVYDCTSQLFTESINIFNLPKLDKAIVYIKWGIDI